MQGIITKKKCKYIREITKSKNNSQIIALTETWAKQNFDAEFETHFKDYNLMRADRKEKTEDNAGDGKYHATRGGGGVILLTSPDITITPILDFSNGNCELAISSLPTINTVTIVMYRPSGKNFDFNKYQEAISTISKFLAENYEDLKDKHSWAILIFLKT